MSDINGNGYGSSHEWKNEGTQNHGGGSGNIFTEYSCSNCKEYFRHFYHKTENIFEAMKEFPVREDCVVKE